MTPVHLFADRLAADPAGPLITFYDGHTGERTEVSALTTANWVAKTANLVRDELLLDPGTVVGIDLPHHWQTLVWLQAAWACGAAVALPPWDTCDAAVVRCSADAPPGSGSVAGETVAVSLLPLGGPCPQLAPGAIDYALEVRAHGDAFGSPPPAPEARALSAGTDAWSHAELVESLPALAHRRIAVATDGVIDAVFVRQWLAVLAGHGSLVILAAVPDINRRREIATAEHAVLLEDE